MKDERIDPNPNRQTSSLSSIDSENSLADGQGSENRMINTEDSTREYTQVQESPQFPIRGQVNQINPQVGMFSVVQNKKKCFVPPKIPVFNPIIVGPGPVIVSQPPPLFSKIPGGPEVLIVQNKDIEKGQSTCPRCGLKVDAADTKIIPTRKVWIFFALLFFCGCWWISWLPFFLKRFYDPVEICPHCFRRLDRPAVVKQ